MASSVPIYRTKLVQSTMSGVLEFTSDPVKTAGSRVIITATCINISGPYLRLRMQGSMNGNSWAVAAPSNTPPLPSNYVDMTALGVTSPVLQYDNCAYTWVRFYGQLAASTTVLFDATFAFSDM